MNTLKNKPGIKNTIYITTTIVITLMYLVTGIGNLLPFQHIAQDMAHLGYPRYFLMLLGIWKILAAITIALPGIPRLKEWAYAGMILDLTGASFSRYSSGDAWPMVIIPLILGVLVTVNYLLRLETTKIVLSGGNYIRQEK